MEKRYKINHDFVAPYAGYKKGAVKTFNEWSDVLKVDFGTLQSWIDETDWFEEVKPEKINVGLTSAGNLPSDQKVMFIVGGHFETQNISQFSSILNRESFTREDMIEFADFFMDSGPANIHTSFENWIKSVHKQVKG